MEPKTDQQKGGGDFPKLVPWRQKSAQTHLLHLLMITAEFTSHQQLFCVSVMVMSEKNPLVKEEVLELLKRVGIWLNKVEIKRPKEVMLEKGHEKLCGYDN